MKEELIIREYERLATTTADALRGLNETIKELNHTSTLHVQSIEKLATVLETDKNLRNKVTYTLVIAIAMLAGLEKFQQLLGL